MDAPTPITPPGWYDDGHGQWRWWDGQRWTDRTAPLQRAAVVTAPAAAAPASELVTVRRSHLVWILPVAFIVTALLGVVAALGVGSTMNFDSGPLKQSYVDFLAAEREQNCAELEQVTTSAFREDLVDPFTCEAWTSRPPTWREGKARWGMALGPVGIVLAEEGFADDSDLHGSPTRRMLVTYFLVKDDGRWLLDNRDEG